MRARTVRVGDAHRLVFLSPCPDSLPGTLCLADGGVLAPSIHTANRGLCVVLHYTAVPSRRRAQPAPRRLPRHVLMPASQRGSRRRRYTRAVTEPQLAGVPGASCSSSNRRAAPLAAGSSWLVTMATAPGESASRAL